MKITQENAQLTLSNFRTQNMLEGLASLVSGNPSYQTFTNTSYQIQPSCQQESFIYGYLL